MFSIQQLIKALRKLQNSGATTAGGDLAKQNLKRVVAAASTTTTTTTMPASIDAAPSFLVYPIPQNAMGDGAVTSKTSTSQQTLSELVISPPTSQPQQLNVEYEQQLANDSSQTRPQQEAYQQIQFRHSHAHDDEVANCQSAKQNKVSLDSLAIENGIVAAGSEYKIAVNILNTTTIYKRAITPISLTTRSQRIHKFYQQHLHHFHTQNNQSLKNKQTYNAMSSLAAEPKSLKQDDTTNGQHAITDTKNASGTSCNGKEQKDSSDKPCFHTGLGEIIKFMELIGNLKHTKRTGWVLRNVSDPESISGHMYRMSMLTFLLDGSEGLNQIRCMELALVHDLAESVVGDLTPFCGVSKTDKRAMELKAMEDICKLIEPRGKRIMELFEEYETGESAESKFVKDLDRLDMIMQAFEYEKRDNCLLRHQEFFDSTEGKFNHPFVKKLVDEIYEQRDNLARSQGATPPPRVDVPDTEALPSTNGQHNERETAQSTVEVPTIGTPKSKTSTSS